MSLNIVIIEGNLTRDIELKMTSNDKPLATCGLAHNSSYKNAQGEWIKKTTFIDFVVFGKQAQNFKTACSKGSPVTIEGELAEDNWEDKNSGQKRSKIKLKANRLHWKSEKKESTARQYEPPPAGPDIGDGSLAPF